MKQQNIDAHIEEKREPIIAIRELAEKARFGGLYYFLGILAGGILTPHMNFRSATFILFCCVFIISMLLRESAYRLSRDNESSVDRQRALKILEAAYCLNSISWTAFTIYLLLLTGNLGEGAAATLISCAGITAGGVTSLIPHNRLIRWYCFFMLVLPAVGAPMLISGSAGWCVFFLYFLYFYYMLRFGRVQSAAYWQARDNYLSLQKYTAELEVAREEALAGSKAKSEFLAKMSHEIRTPMNGVVGISQVLENTLLDLQQRKYVQIIRDSGATLLQIIDDILDFSKLEANKMGLHPASFNLSQLVADLREIFSLQLSGRPVQLITRISDELPPWISADPIRIRQILYNLIGNAIKFTQEGEIIVDLEFQKIDISKGRVKFIVTDSGIGIPKNVQSLVFTQFERFTTQSSAKGTGLGLVICKRLVEIMGGAIGFQSSPGVGSCFWFEVPVAIVDESSFMQEAHSADAVEAALPTNLAILVVEDDLVNQLVIQHQLEYLGNRAFVVDNGESAISIFQEQSFDFVLMDYNLPVMSGVEAVKIIRAWEREHRERRTPIIALTAHALNEIKQECFEAGMDDYLTKPVIATELRHIIARWSANANAAHT
jgi:signal transduction histidine kinase/CheY-like chemotaxis protein